MSMADVHAALVRRLEFLHRRLLEASDGLGEIQFRGVGGRCNHANWLVGHHLWEKDVLLAEWPTGQVLRPDGLTDLYGFGSVPAQAGACPDIEVLRTTIADLHAPTLALIDPASLTQAGVRAPEVFPTRLDLALHFIHDASYHLGQLDYVRKILGVG